LTYEGNGGRALVKDQFQRWRTHPITDQKIVMPTADADQSGSARITQKRKANANAASKGIGPV
jgi:hypothetical protein